MNDKKLRADQDRYDILEVQNRQSLNSLAFHHFFMFLLFLCLLPIREVLSCKSTKITLLNHLVLLVNVVHQPFKYADIAVHGDINFFIICVALKELDKVLHVFDQNCLVAMEVLALISGFVKYSNLNSFARAVSNHLRSFCLFKQCALRNLQLLRDVI